MPVLQNCTVPPIPDERRSYAFGARLGHALRASTPEGARIGVFGTGGLSHEPGGPRYLEIDEKFDRWFLDLLAQGTTSASSARRPWSGWRRRGPGTAELLSWLAVMGAVGERDCEVLCYACVPEWRCGVGAVAWSV